MQDVEGAVADGAGTKLIADIRREPGRAEPEPITT